MTTTEAKKIIWENCIKGECEECSFYKNHECNVCGMLPPCLWKDEDENEQLTEARATMKNFCLFETDCGQCRETENGNCKQNAITPGTANAYPVRIPAAWYIEDVEDKEKCEEEEDGN